MQAVICWRNQNAYVVFSQLNRKPDGKDTNHLGAKNLAGYAQTYEHTNEKKNVPSAKRTLFTRVTYTTQNRRQ